MKRHWTEDDRDEYDALLVEASAAGTVRDQVDALRAGVRDAVQAQRVWAYEVEDEAMRAGLAAILKRWQKARRRMRAKRGDRVVDRPGVVGIRRAAVNGAEAAIQLELDLLTREELNAKRAEYLTQLRAYGDNLAVVDALRSLLDAAPEAANAREAAASLGTTVEAWLLGDAA